MEMVRSACDPRWRNVAGALSAGEGNAKVSGLERRTDTTSAIVANSLLMHAFNREDSYCTAAHPGLVVVPTALALQRSDDAAQLLKAVAVGYAIAGSLTDGLMPRASEAGWRVAALTAPVTAASVAAVLLDLDDDDAVSALRISAACMGGDLRTLAGDDWRVQPGLFAVAGVYAARAAIGGGVRGTAGALESIAAKVLGEPWHPADHDPTPAIMRVTFKRHAAPMFAQAIIEALEGAGEIDEPVNQVVVHVAPFAAGYASDGTGRQLGVASIPDLVSAAIARASHRSASTSRGRRRASGCGAQRPRGPRGAAHGGRTGAAAPRQRRFERLVERAHRREVPILGAGGVPVPRRRVRRNVVAGGGRRAPAGCVGSDRPRRRSAHC